MYAEEPVGSLRASLTTQLGLSHLVTGVVAVAVALELPRLGMRPLAALGGAALVAAAVGLVLTLPLQRALSELERALARLGRGERAELAADGWWWPLATFAARVRAVGARVETGQQRERRALEEREQLLRQAGEAGALEERNRLARELHDSIKQQIFAITVSAAAARARWDNDPGAARAAVEDIQQSAHEAQVELQALLQELRPATLEQVGLVEALRTQCQALGYRTGAQVSLDLGDLPDEQRLPPGAAEAIFRIAQEGLANAARHARAEHITLRLRRQAAALELQIEDDGQGFIAEQAPRGIGLASMRERAATLGGGLTLRTAPGAGTTLRVRVPLVEPLSSEETARLDPALSNALAAARRGQNLGTNALSITWLLLLVGLPVYLVALGEAAGLVCYLNARASRVEVARLTGRSSPWTLALGYVEHGLLEWLALFAVVGVWYLPAVQSSWAAGARLGLVIGATVVLAGMALVEQARSTRALERSWSGLALDELRHGVEQSQSQLAGYSGLWLLIVVLTIAFGSFHPGFPPHGASQWADDASLAVLALLPATLLVDGVQIVRWRRRMARQVLAAERRA